MYRRRYVMLSLLFVFALIAGACTAAVAPTGEEAMEEPVAAESDGEQVELRIAWWGSQNRHDRTIAVIEMFEELHPEIDVVYEFSGWDDHWTKMATQAAGGNLPDIMQQDYARIEEWNDRELLLALDEYIDDGTLDFSNVSDGELDGGRIDGKLYAVNLGTNSQNIIIDTDESTAERSICVDRENLAKIRPTLPLLSTIFREMMLNSGL